MLPKNNAQPDRHFHAVRFYENTTTLCRIVADFVGEGFAAGSPALVIATPEHRDAIIEELTLRGRDTARLQAAGQLVFEDAERMLATFLRDGMPDGELFRSAVGPVLQAITSMHGPRVIRTYGEMVDVLWRGGHTVAAVRLEMLWNELAQTHDFALLCGYSMGNFYKDASIEEICSTHTDVLAGQRPMRPVQ
jgi:hypothetical protein